MHLRNKSGNTAYPELGYSGTTLDRPALQRLLNVVSSGCIEQLVIDWLVRLSRNMRHFTTLFWELVEHGVGSATRQ